jgi:uncharacterized repeat protein (TIGR01451 family)
LGIGHWVLVILLLLGFTTGAHAFVFTRTSSAIFYIDTSVTPALQTMYVAYQINNNSGVNYPDVWAKIDSFSGGVVSLGPTEDGLVHLGALSAGQTKTAFFFIQASSATSTPQSHTVRLYPTRPPAGELVSQSFSMTVEETIQANANQVQTVVAGPNPPQLGGIVTVTVRGTSGTLGFSQVMAFNPAAYLSWRADAFELVATTVTLSRGNSGTYNDTLYLVAANSSDTDYAAVYTYRTVGTTTTPTPVSPISFISSGQQIKHTRVDNFAQFDPILPVENKLTVGKTASPTQSASNGPITFTLIATNSGTIDAVLEDFTDTLPTTPASPTYVSSSSRYNGVAIADPVLSGSTLTWVGTFAIPAGTTRSLTFQVNLPTANGTYTNRGVAHISTNQIDTTLVIGDNAPAVATVLLRIPIVSGLVYLDTNRNLQRDAGEAGTGLSLFAKLVRSATPGGPALQAVSVNGASGSYGFTNVAPGSYLILIDNNSTLSDVAANLPAGWIGTEMPNQVRTNVVVMGVDVPDQNFGLINGTTISGRVFRDTGIGSGTANDGNLNGGESGISGVAVALVSNSGTTNYDTTVTDGNGNYSLYIPASLTNGTALKVVETNPVGFLSTGGSVGNTGGTYNRSTDTIAFTLSAGTTYVNVNFGDVPPNSFVPNGTQSGLPGSFVVYAHTFIAGSAGQVSFVASNAPNPAIAGWTQSLYRDINCNGQLDSGDAILSNPIVVTAGQQVCILVRESIPLLAPFNAEDTVTLRANFDYVGANPVLSTNYVVTDVTFVGNPSTAGLTLIKSADKAAAKPGEAITYTITYANTSSENLSNIVLYDSTPAYTTFLGATNGPLSTNLTSVSVSAPIVGSAGAVRWTFTGSLAPGRSGAVMFSVNIAQ